MTWRERPSLGSILRAIELPDIGGDTLFANMVMAYDQLSDAMKAKIDGLVAVHDIARVFAKRLGKAPEELHEKYPPTEHPVVRTHPETAKKALFVNPAHACHFDGWTEAESEGLLSYLFAHQVRPEFLCRHVWQTGDIALWDNRCTLHYPVNDYHGHRRLLHRITLKGDRPV